MFRLVVAGGGTGGHLYPGIAVAREVTEEGGEVLFIGTEAGIEARVLPREGFRLVTIRAGRFKGMGLTEKIRALMLVPVGIMASMRTFKEFRPDTVLGVGGYASLSAVAAARLVRIPVVIQEQNAYPGLTNRTLGRFADKVALGFKEAAPFFPEGSSVHTGNPVRSGLGEADRSGSLKAFGLDEDKATVLVFGGSGGAHSINMAVTESLGMMDSLTGGLQFIHQTGEKDQAVVEDAYRKSGFTAAVLPFIYDMAAAYASADLVVCRSGALTIAELTSIGKPSVLVPYPHAANNHQELNARVLDDAGAARMVLDRELSGGRIASEITGLVGDVNALSGMAGRCLTLGRPDAAKKVLGLCKAVAGLDK